MGIKGDVRSISLANVLQDLVTNEQTGTLAIRHKKDRQALYLWFDKGALKLVGLGNGQGPSLVNGLLALEKIKPEDAPVVSGRHTSEGGFVRGLLKKGKIAREDLKAACEHQMGEHLSDAFLWNDATFEFEEGEPDDRGFDVDQLDLEPRLAVEGAIMEAVRRADEWGETRKAILSQNEILVPDPARLPKEAEPTIRRIFGLLDGERSLRDIQELTRLGQFMLLRGAALLIRSGACRPLSAADAFERGRARAGKKEWDAALKMARYGLEHERKNTGLLELALRCAEELQDHDGAASFARQLASAQAESGALEEAIKSYHKVLAHAPRDLTAHERLFQTLLQLDLKLDALAAGEGLASAYKKAGLPDKALAVYQQLLEKVGDHSELIESVAEIQRHLGDKAEAVKLYVRLLERAMEAKNDQLSLDYCRTILKLDPRHEEALALRNSLESGQVEKARQRKRLIRTLVGTGLALALVFAAAVYEFRARDNYNLVRSPIRDAQAKDLREVLRLYDSVIDRYRYSLISRELRPDREDEESRFVKQEMDSAAEFEKKGQLPEAIAALDGTIPLLKMETHLGLVINRRAELLVKRGKAEQEWSARLARMEPKEIGLVSDALAVPALAGLVSGKHRSEKPLVRQAAVSALGGIEGEASVSGLISALRDGEPAVRLEAAAHLVKKKRAPLQASLVGPREPVVAGAALGVEWRVTNLSPAEVDLALEEAPTQRFKLTGPNGPIAYSLAGGERRVVRLGPGEFVGGSFPDLTLNMPVPGRYTATWAAAVTWNNLQIVLPAPTLFIDRR
jgi:tetratricopeptide (TPR) repeat protein